MKTRLLSLLFALCASVFSYADTLDFIQVQGAGTVNATPDFISFSVYVEESGELVSKLHQISQQKVQSAQKFLIDNGVAEEDIQAMRMNLNPNVQYERNQPVQRGFNLSQQINIRLRNLSDYPQIMDGLFRLGVNRMDGFRYEIENYDNHYLRALKLALKNAQSKAKSISASAGRELGPVIQVSEQGGGMPVRRMRGNLMAAAESGQVQVMPGQLQVTASTSVTYAIE